MEKPLVAKKPTPNTPNTTTPTTPAETAPDTNMPKTDEATETVVEPTDGSAESAITRASDSEIVDADGGDEYVPDNTMGYLSIDLPHLEKKLKSMERVTPHALNEVMAHLTPDEKKLLQNYQERLTGEDDTAGEGSSVSLLDKIPNAKLFQSGDPAGRPTGLPAGSIYIQHGQALATLPEQAETVGIPAYFTAAVVGHFHRRMFWPGEDKANPGKRLFPEDYPEDRMGPICQSLDQQQGVYYGNCPTCPFNPNATRGENMGCKNEGTLFLMLPDFSLIRAELTGSSVGIIDTILKKSNLWGMRYAYFFRFTVKAKKSADGKNSYKAWETSLHISAEQKNGVPTSVGFRKVAAIYAAKIRTEWYYPALAEQYAQAARERANKGKEAPKEKGPSDAQKAMDAARAMGEENNM